MRVNNGECNTVCEACGDWSGVNHCRVCHSTTAVELNRLSASCGSALSRENTDPQRSATYPDERLRRTFSPFQRKTLVGVSSLVRKTMN